MSWIQRVLYGVDLDEEQYRQNQLDAALAAENAKDREKYGDAWFEEVSANLEESRIDVEAEVDREFEVGLQEGADNVTSVISKPFEIAGKAAGSVLSAFPWWIWMIGLAALAFTFWPVLGPLLGARLKR